MSRFRLVIFSISSFLKKFLSFNIILLLGYFGNSNSSDFEKKFSKIKMQLRKKFINLLELLLITKISIAKFSLLISHLIKLEFYLSCNFVFINISILVLFIIF